jgi:hypothetical protein
MNTLCCTLAGIGLCLTALPSHAAPKPATPTPAAAAPVQVRKPVERSLHFLEKEGVAWLATNKCGTCHHAPMMLWTHHEALRHGFAVNRKAVDDVQRQALAEYLGAPEYKPTSQDRNTPKRGPGPGAVYLALGIEAGAALDQPTAQALAKLTSCFAGMQEKDGSWSLKSKGPPLADGDDGFTMFIALSLDPAHDTPATREARRRALHWLRASPPRAETQQLALRIIVESRFGTAAAAKPWVRQLLGQQNADGGWSQAKERPSDALATGQALYALGTAGTGADDPAVRRAWGYLLGSQRADGSWRVRSRNPTMHVRIISYVGTGWATLGLLRTLPKGA